MPVGSVCHVNLTDYTCQQHFSYTEKRTTHFTEGSQLSFEDFWANLFQTNLEMKLKESKS